MRNECDLSIIINTLNLQFEAYFVPKLTLYGALTRYYMGYTIGLYKWKLNFVTIFAHNWVTTTEKQSNWQQKTWRQLRSSHWLRTLGWPTNLSSEFCFNLGPRVFLRTARGGWFCLFVFVICIIALCIIQTKKLLYEGNLYVLPAKDEEPLSFCSGNTCMLWFCSSHGKYANSTYIE